MISSFGDLNPTSSVNLLFETSSQRSCGKFSSAENTTIFLILFLETLSLTKLVNCARMVMSTMLLF